MRYNKNRLKSIEYSIGFFKDILRLQEDKLENLRDVYKPSGYSTGISYNDYNNVQTSVKQDCIFEVAVMIKVTQEEIRKTKEIIENYQIEKSEVEKYIEVIRKTTSDKLSLKEKILKLKEIELSKSNISKILECSYKYVNDISKGRF